MCETLAEFDRLAEIYDESIGTGYASEVGAIERALSRHRCQIVLDIGVGTGRVAKPLEECVFEVVGVDVSLPMLVRAKCKGLKNLILADAEWLPFREKAFDATIIVDVLNCLDDPLTVFLQVERVTVDSVIAIKRKYNRNKEEGKDDPKFARLRERVAKLRVLSDGVSRSWEREDRIIELYPPSESKIVSDHVIETSAEGMISRFEKGAFRFTTDVPPEQLVLIGNELRHEMQGSSFKRRRIREMHVWNVRALPESSKS